MAKVCKKDEVDYRERPADNKDEFEITGYTVKIMEPSKARDEFVNEVEYGRKSSPLSTELIQGATIQAYDGGKRISKDENQK